MEGLTPYQQRKMYNDVQDILKWVKVTDAELIAGCKKRKLQQLASTGKINIGRVGKSTEYFREDLEKLSSENSTNQK